MNRISGYIYTHNEDGAKAARFSFFAFLNAPAFDIDYYAKYRRTKEGLGSRYELHFTNVSLEIWERFCSVWVGENAHYPNQVGCCVYKHEELR